MAVTKEKVEALVTGVRLVHFYVPSPLQGLASSK